MRVEVQGQRVRSLGLELESAGEPLAEIGHLACIRQHDASCQIKLRVIVAQLQFPAGGGATPLPRNQPGLLTAAGQRLVEVREIRGEFQLQRHVGRGERVIGHRHVQMQAAATESVDLQFNPFWITSLPDGSAGSSAGSPARPAGEGEW